MSERITSSIVTWPGGRWKAQMFVDGFPVRKGYFNSKIAAEQWCMEQAKQLAFEVR